MSRPNWTRTRTANTAVGAVALVAALALPFAASPFLVFQGAMLISYVIALLGLNLLTGHSGQISLGHGAFYAAGAYTGAIFTRVIPSDWGYLVALPVAAVFCFAFGYVFGVPAQRLKGPTLALGTLALAVAVPPLLKRFEGITGGSVGLTVPTPEAPPFLPLAQDQWTYLLALAVLVVSLVLSRNLQRGRLGRAFNSVRDNDIAAQAMGVRITHYKVLAFALAAMFGGVGGVVYTWSTGYVSPNTFGLLLSIYFIAGMILGGMGTVVGPFIGAAFIYLVPSTLGRINDAAPGVLFGIVLIVVVLVFPGGIGGLVKKGWDRVVGGRSSRRPATRTEAVVAEPSTV
ncbi:branched-chain amino acid ABC transporter permease [Dietzia kunjamensis]|uniref:branched-chain amino acid ABC transporter permease n=1 Tax=Dietzia kunjamensis TaxID=322509 RepID=UPI003369A080